MNAHGVVVFLVKRKHCFQQFCLLICFFFFIFVYGILYYMFWILFYFINAQIAYISVRAGLDRGQTVRPPRTQFVASYFLIDKEPNLKNIYMYFYNKNEKRVQFFYFINLFLKTLLVF